MTPTDFVFKNIIIPIDSNFADKIKELSNVDIDNHFKVFQAFQSYDSMLNFKKILSTYSLNDNNLQINFYKSIAETKKIIESNFHYNVSKCVFKEGNYGGEAVQSILHLKPIIVNIINSYNADVYSGLKPLVNFIESAEDLYFYVKNIAAEICYLQALEYREMIYPDFTEIFNQEFAEILLQNRANNYNFELELKNILNNHEVLNVLNSNTEILLNKIKLLDELKTIVDKIFDLNLRFEFGPKESYIDLSKYKESLGRFNVNSLFIAKSKIIGLAFTDGLFPTNH